MCTHRRHDEMEKRLGGLWWRRRRAKPLGPAKTATVEAAAAAALTHATQRKTL